MTQNTPVNWQLSGFELMGLKFSPLLTLTTQNIYGEKLKNMLTQSLNIKELWTTARNV